MLPRTPHSRIALILVLGVAAACNDGSDSSSLATPPVLPGQVDLSVGKTVDDPSPGEGQVLEFEITVANSALGSDATAVHARDLLPQGLTFVSATPAQGTYDALTGLWSIGNLSSGASATLLLSATVDAGTLGTTIENQVDELGADEVDPNPANDTAAVSVGVVAMLDLAVAKTVDVGAPVEGATVVYTVEVSHSSGGVAATGIAVVDSLPLGLDFVSSTQTLGSYTPATGRWDGFNLVPGTSATLSITARVGPGTAGTTIVNQAALSELDQQDSSPANDASSAPISVADDTNLALTKSVNVATPHEGDVVTFTVSLVNEGPAFATNVVVTDLLPPGLTYQFHNQDLGDYTDTTGVWSISGLTAGPTVRKLVIHAQVDAGTGGTTIVNTATLTALDEDDTNPADDSASASITVDANADLALSLSVDDASPARRQPVTLTLAVSNALGAAQATSVLVSIPLPSGLSHQAHAAGAGTYDPVSGLWSVGVVDAGESQSLSITAAPEVGTSGQALDVVATIAGADQPDPNAANDSDAVALAVDGELVEIVNDVFGVPHVFAHSDQGACFGAGYATAKHRLSQMLWNRLVVTGRIAEFFGRGANHEFFESDRRVRLYGVARHAAEAALLLDPELRSLLESYADGVNAFMASPTAVLHPVFAQQGVPLEPWTPKDSIAIWNEFGRSFGPSELLEAERLHEYEDLVEALNGDVDQALAQLIVPAILDESAAVVKQSDVPAPVQQAMADYASSLGMSSVPLVASGSGPEFSQVWAVTPDKTVDQRPLLVCDPRIPIRRPNLLFEIHLRGTTFDVRGAGPPGAFGWLVGSTENVVWGASALGLDQADLFRIHTDPLEPGKYLLDGVFRPFEVDEIEAIAIKGETPVNLRYRETVFGPIVTSLVKDFLPGEEYAVRSTLNYEPERVAAEGYLAMVRAGNVVQFAAALGEMRYPSMNVVFGDAGGRIGYWANGAVPARSTASPVSAFGGRAALDGDVSANDWIEIIPHGLMPWVLDPADDVLFSANHMPVGSWYPIRIGLDQQATGDTSRSRRLRELLVGAPPLAPADVSRIRNDSVHSAARDLVRLALHAKVAHNAVFEAQAEKALLELEPWRIAGAKLEVLGPGGPSVPGQRGVLIAAMIEDTFRAGIASKLIPIYGAGSAGAHRFFKTRIAELEGGLALLTPDEIEYLELALGDAMDKVDLMGVAPSQWLATYEADFLTIDVPAWTDLNGFQSLDPLDVLQVGPLTSTDTRVLGAQPEESYGQNVRVGTPDAARSFSPFGQGEPDSAHAIDQLGLLESKVLHPSPTSRAGVEALGPFSVDALVF